MKRYHFRLATLLRVRRLDASLARQRLAVTTRDLTAAYEAVAEAQQGYDTLPDLLPATDTTSFTDWRARGERAALALAVARAAAADAASRRESARSAAAEAEIRVRVLERLEERRLEQWRLDNARADATALDELANARAAADRMERRGDD